MTALLGPDDAPSVKLHNPAGASLFLLIGDHAGNVIPKALGDLGLPLSERERHIGWDIGVAALGEALSARLDAVFIRQTYSRLVIDCNRDPTAADACPVVSDGTAVPGNADLSLEARRARIAEIHEPYQAAIEAEIARRAAAGMETVLVSLHSFTPVMKGFARPWDIGVLHDGANDGFALALLERLRAEPGLTVGDNEPYRMDTVDHTVPRHAFQARLPYVELEIRQDHLADAASVETWTERLAGWLTG